MVSHQPARFGGHRRCGSGDMMFVVVEGQDSTCPCFYVNIYIYIYIYKYVNIYLDR